MDKIRNFAIIAHIDHGKSTLADRLLEATQTVDQRQMKQQLLDKMDLEREKGITIKLSPVTMKWGQYYLNLIDTPGHVDFSYEVSRSLAACEGALLVIDAAQGVQAQTLANLQLALKLKLSVIPIINKIDLPAADIDRCTTQIKNLLDCLKKDILLVSAKTGQGVEKLLQEIVVKLPPPQLPVKESHFTKALIFDSYYDDYRGVILYVRLISGQIKVNDLLLMMAGQTSALALEVGHLKPQFLATKILTAGEFGYIVTNLKTTAQARVGDTVTSFKKPAQIALVGYRPAKTYIFAGLFLVDGSAYANLKKALEKLALSDSTLVYELENSPILGHGFRCGFLGLLHLEIITERLKREYGLEIIVSNPSTAYQVVLSNGDTVTIKTAAELQGIRSQVLKMREPWVKGKIVCQPKHVGAMIQLIVGARGQPQEIDYAKQLAVLNFTAPLANLLTDFYDRLKSLTSGYGSLDYEFSAWQTENLVKLDFYVAYELVEALSLICHSLEAQKLAKTIVHKLKEIIPRQQFKIALQGAIGGKIIARADIASYRKDVTAKLYGGDVTRRKKLLEQQKKGKAKLKRIGKVDLPPSAFTVLLQKDKS